MSRSYLYQISRRRTAFAKPFVGWIRESLDIDAMRRAAEAAGRDPKAIEITLAAPPEASEIETLARQGVTRVAVPVSAAAGLPAQVKTPDDVLR